MKVVRITLLSALLSLFTAGLIYGSDSGDNDWPRWRGKDMNGKSSEKGVFKFDQGYGLKVSWKKPLGSSYSSVSIADGRAVTMFSDSTFDYVVALDVDNGDELWRFKLDSTYKGHDGSHDGQLSTPTIDGDKIYVYAIKGHLLALDAKTGKKLWSHNVKSEINPLEPRYGFGSSPIVVDDVLMCQVGDPKTHTICGFDKNSGKLLWSAAADTINYQSPISMTLLGEEQVIGVGDHKIFGVKPADGEILWEYRHNGRESALLKFSKSDDKYQIEEVWKNRNIRGSYNTSIYQDGYLYGYSGQFLTCVNARTGETAWKSRPPGQGLFMVVDGHLVIVTVRGTMHVAKASPEAYVELASTQVFNGLTWTPISFANGSIYARSLTEIARVDIAPVDQLTLDQPEIQVVNPEGNFAKFVKKAEAASDADKKKMVEEFVGKNPKSPHIEEGKFAHIYYYGEAKDMAMAGDMLPMGQEVPLTNIPGTDFFFASYELEADARLDYYLRHDFDNVITDPRNSHSVGSFTSPSQQASALRMPEWNVPTHFDEPNEGVARGTIETFEFESTTMGNTRNLHVYLPAGYADAKNRYPTVFVNYGNWAKDMGLMPNSLDNLIAGGMIHPVIAVFVEAPQSGQEYSRNGRDNFAKMYAEELISHIDDKYRTKANADSRLLMGGDEGGFAAFFAAFTYPDKFLNIACQSTHFYETAGGAELKKLVEESDKLPINIYMEWSENYELRYGNGLSWKDLNVAAHQLLIDKGYKVTAVKTNHGFGFGSWRVNTDKILTKFFGKTQTMK